MDFQFISLLKISGCCMDFNRIERMNLIKTDTIKTYTTVNLQYTYQFTRNKPKANQDAAFWNTTSV